MTKEEKLIVSAYTGVLMVNFADLHKFIEEKLERQIFIHELCSDSLATELKIKVKQDFLRLCEENE